MTNLEMKKRTLAAKSAPSKTKQATQNSEQEKRKTLNSTNEALFIGKEMRSTTPAFV